MTKRCAFKSRMEKQSKEIKEWRDLMEQMNNPVINSDNECVLI